MSVQFEQLRDRAMPWMQPIPAQDAAAAGAAGAKFLPAYQAAAAEMARLDTPAGGAVDWKKVSQLCEGLLRTTTKDLLIGVWLAHALHRLRGLDGLTTGATLLAEMIDQLWETLQPEVKRQRARVNALQWFLEKTALALPEADLAASDLPGLEALLSATQRLAQVVRFRFADAAPAMSPVLERIERLRASAAEAAAREAPPAAPPEAPGDAPVAAAPSFSGAAKPEARLGPPPPAVGAMPAVPAGDLASGAEAVEFLRTVGAALISAAATLRRADAADPSSYRLLRTGMWLHISAPPPAAAGKTQVPAPPPALRAQLAALAQNQRWSALLEEAESAAPQQRFALDLQRLSWQALEKLGATHERARHALLAEVRSLLARLPQLAGLSFSDGSPLADVETRAWIAAEIEARPGGPSSGPGEGGEGEAAAARLAEARKLFGANQPAEALSLLQQGVVAARAGRERFLARLQLARSAAGAGLPAIAKASYEDLARESAARDLDGWEPPLVADCLKGLIAATRALSGDPRGANADLTQPYARLCRVDPVSAHEVWP